MDWAIFNLIIGNADAHGKNISFFVNKSSITVAPYYDMLSIIMHKGVDHELAMAYGDEFDADNILGYPLREFSEETELNPKLVSTRIKTVCKNLRKALNSHTIDMTLFTDKEKEFTDKLHLLISKRIDALLLSADAENSNKVNNSEKDIDRLHKLLSDKRTVIRWVFTGDSITHGALHTAGWRDYVQLFEERIRWELKRKNDIVIKTATSGWTIYNIANDLESNVLIFSPKVVSISVGMNDCVLSAKGVKSLNVFSVIKLYPITFILII